MSSSNTNSGRRNFFLRGGAMLGAGMAVVVGSASRAGAAPAADEIGQLRRQLAGARDQEAIRQLHLDFMARVADQRYEAVAELFAADAELRLGSADAVGNAAIQRLFAEQYRQQRLDVFHSAYRRGVSQQQDVVLRGEDGVRATSRFHVDVELSRPLRGDSTVVRMARLQGQVADRRWEPGRFDAECVKSAGRWQLQSLVYRPA